MKGIDFIRDRDAIADDLGEFELSCNAQIYALGMVLELDVEFVYSPSHFGNCDSYDLHKVRVIGHYPEGDQSEAFNRGKYVPVNMPIDLDRLSEEEIADIKESCAAYVAKSIKEGEGY